MILDIQRIDVWAAPVPDRPGGVAELLAGLRKSGADLQFVLARRAPDKPGTGVVFVTPLEGEAQVRAATALGFSATQSVRSLRVMGLDKPGALAELSAALAEGGISLRGLTASVLGSQFIAYLGLDSEADLASAIDILGRL